MDCIDYKIILDPVIKIFAFQSPEKEKIPTIQRHQGQGL
jgi:hypothetical protein